MSLVSEIKNSIRHLKDSRKAVSAVGGDISNAAGLKDLPRGIRTITANLSLGYFVSEETKFTTHVPKNVEEFALIKKVGGMTYKENDVLINTKVTSIESQGVNLLDMSKAVNANFVDNGDGTYTITCSSTNRFSKDIPLYIPAITEITISYIHVGGDTKAKVAFTYMDGSKWYPNVMNREITYTVEKDLKSIVFYLHASEQGQSATFSFQVQYGSKATEHEPYEKLSTLLIPQRVQELPDYGSGINADYYNYIQYRDGRWYYVQTCIKQVFTGEEWWVAYNEGKKRYYARDLKSVALGTKTQDAILSDNLPRDNSKLTATTEACWSFHVETEKTYLRVRPSNDMLNEFTTNTEWRNHLAERYANGNPLVLIYALAEPIETDITDLMARVSPFIKVKGGGAITFHNEHKNAVPLEIKYIIKAGA